MYVCVTQLDQLGGEQDLGSLGLLEYPAPYLT